MTDKTKVAQVYESTGLDQQQEAYDSWADQYEKDLCAMGYRIPAMIGAVFVKYVAPDTSPILDAGCGGGIQAEALAMLGYGPITGIDLSEGMLAIARSKNIYADLQQATLGERLEFPDKHFAAVISSGTITPKHAPPHAFEELIRVAKPGAPIVFSMRNDPMQDPDYPAMIEKLEGEGKWQHLFSTDGFHSMPYGEPEISNQIHVYKVL